MLSGLESVLSDLTLSGSGVEPLVQAVDSGSALLAGFRTKRSLLRWWWARQLGSWLVWWSGSSSLWQATLARGRDGISPC